MPACSHNPTGVCDNPHSDLTVSLPTDLIAAMQVEAADAGRTVDDMVQSAFANVRNRVCPCIKSPS